MGAVNSRAGCWVVIASLPETVADGGLLDVPYWMRPEGALRRADLRGDGHCHPQPADRCLVQPAPLWAARPPGAAASAPAATARHPSPRSTRCRELGRVAAEFDRMVAKLRNSARSLRRAAEDNTHALKTPIAVIRQSLEPVAASVPREHERGRGALSRIDNALDRLDGLVSRRPPAR